MSDLDQNTPESEPVAELVVEPTPDPVVEPTPDPVVEPAAEEVAEPVVEPAAEEVAEPVVEPVVEVSLPAVLLEAKKAYKAPMVSPPETMNVER